MTRRRRVTMSSSSEDLMEAGHLVKDRWRVVSIWGGFCDFIVSVATATLNYCWAIFQDQEKLSVILLIPLGFKVHTCAGTHAGSY